MGILGCPNASSRVTSIICSSSLDWQARAQSSIAFRSSSKSVVPGIVEMASPFRGPPYAEPPVDTQSYRGPDGLIRLRYPPKLRYVRIAHYGHDVRYAEGMPLFGCPAVTSIANIALMRGGDPLTRREVLIFSLVAGVGLLVSICWNTVDVMIKRFYGRNWPTVSAVIDAVGVSLVESKIPSSGAVHNWPSYLALTYSYRNREQQMGDYSRQFAKQEDAEAWANSYKGDTVKVHLDPRDPTRSVLREEDL